MATLTNRHHSTAHWDVRVQEDATASVWAAPVGRFFYSLIFILSGLNHFSSDTIGYAAAHGIPMAGFLVPFAGILAIVGGLSVLLGYQTKVGGLILLLFLVPVTILMHNFWAVSDPAAAQMQFSHFMKNLALIGGAILFSAYGAGPVSFDDRMLRHQKRP